MEGMKYGYARISTEDQNAAMQRTALKRAGCKTLFTDELSGAITKRPALLRCMKKLERADTLMVWKLDRLGRSLRDLITMLDSLRDRGVKFRSITEANRHRDAHGPGYVADDRHDGRVRT
jgi:DNA invertase Pin-like site-specific DNA recombinase